MADQKGTKAIQSSKAMFGSRTDVGCVRDHNEDSLVVAPPLFVVADGMGGHAAGEVASEIAVDTIAKLAPKTPDTEALGKAVIAANYAVINAAQEKGRHGMGTTMTAAILDKERLAIAQVGDSRAYLLHQGHMQQLTRDHSLMADMIEAGEITPEEARVHPQRSVITRALGTDPNMQPDLYEINVTAGDRLLLCSDGLTSMLEDFEIQKTLEETRDPQKAATLLVNQAIAAGGFDNVTVIVVDIAGNSAKQLAKTRRHSVAWGIFVVLLLIAVVVGICYGSYRYVSNLAYLHDDNGQVAVYQGIRGNFFGHDLSHLDSVTDVNTDDLQPGTASHLREDGIRADNLDEAYSLVDQYRDYVDQNNAEQEAREQSAREAQEARNQNSNGSSNQNGTSSNSSSSNSSSSNSTSGSNGSSTTQNSQSGSSSSSGTSTNTNSTSNSAGSTNSQSAQSSSTTGNGATR